MSLPEELMAEPLAVLKDRLLPQPITLLDSLLEALSHDSRRGAQELAAKLHVRRQQGCVEAERLANLLRFETELWAQGMNLIAGVDEAGMGPSRDPWSLPRSSSHKIISWTS